jgi:GT2 family glycosyltransferase
MFLYGEEFVLGKKVLDVGKHFVLDPKLRVRHYQGVSTGFEYQSAKWHMYRHRISSTLHYCTTYLGTTRTKCGLLLCCMVLGYCCRVVCLASPLRFLLRRMAATPGRATLRWRQLLTATVRHLRG